MQLRLPGRGQDGERGLGTQGGLRASRRRRAAAPAGSMPPLLPAAALATCGPRKGPSPSNFQAFFFLWTHTRRSLPGPASHPAALGCGAYCSHTLHTHICAVPRTLHAEVQCGGEAQEGLTPGGTCMMLRRPGTDIAKGAEGRSGKAALARRGCNSREGVPQLGAYTEGKQLSGVEQAQGERTVQHRHRQRSAQAPLLTWKAQCRGAQAGGVGGLKVCHQLLCLRRRVRQAGRQQAAQTEAGMGGWLPTQRQARRRVDT